MTKAASSLERIYRTYNRKYFDGLLPDDLNVWWCDDLTQRSDTHNVYGLTLVIEDDETQHTLYHIYINPDTHLDREQIRLTLLHEMIHVKLHPYMFHGRRFEEEKTRLAIRGALKGLW